MIGFSRVQGNAHFYGSELEQDHYIECKIHTSEVDKDLSKYWFYAKKRILTLRMTSGQFSEMITSMNRGDGVPCTLEYVNGEHVEKLPFTENRKTFTHKKFKERMNEFAKFIKENSIQAKSIINKKTLSKQDIKDLNMNIDWLTTEISNNIPFFLECFQEGMDEVVKEAKMEIENAIQHKINTLGLEALHNQNKLLE